MSGRYELFAAVSLLAISLACGQVSMPVDWACTNCVFENDGVTPRTIRAMFMPGQDVVQNPLAESKAAMLGREYSCTDPLLAVPECFDARNWNEGWVARLGWQIFDTLGVQVVGLTAANFSSTSFQVYDGVSSFTRCVWEVYLGNVDICVGDFWETDERRRIATFSSLFDLDTMRLVTRRNEDSTGFKASMLMRVFDPFEPVVWALVVGTLFFASAALYAVEAGGNNSDYTLEETADLVLVRIALGVSKSLWIGLMSFLTASPQHRTTRWSGRIISFAFGMFIYVTVASYYAALLDFLFKRNDSLGAVEDLNDLIGRGEKLCLLDAIGDVVSQVPNINRVRLDDYGPMLEKLHKSLCAGAIIGKTAYQQLVLAQDGTFTVCSDPRDPKGFSTCQNASHTVTEIDLGNCKCPGDAGRDPFSCPEGCPNHHKYCSIIDTEDTSLNLAIGVAWPVSQPIKDYVSAWVVNLRLSGKIQILRDTYIRDRYLNVCPTPPPTSPAITIEQMAGTYVIAAGLMCIGVIVYFWQNMKLPHEIRVVTEDEILDGELENEGHEVDEPVPGRKRHVNPFTAIEGDVVSEVSFMLAQVGQRLDMLEVNARRAGQVLFIPKSGRAGLGSLNGQLHAAGNGTALGRANGHSKAAANGDASLDSFADMYATGKQVSFYEPDADTTGEH